MRRLSLHFKLTLAISALIIVFAAFFAYYFPSRQARAAQDGLETRAKGLATMLGFLSATSLEYDQADDAKTMFEAVKTDVDLRYVLVLHAKDNSVFARYEAQGVNENDEVFEQTSQLRVSDQKGYLHVLAPLVAADSKKPIGTLVAGFSKQSLSKARSDSQRTALIVSLVMLLVGIAAAWFISASITRPILSATAQLTAVSSDLLGAAREQESSVAEEASAIDETKRTMERLLSSAQQIAESSSAVLGNAERTTQGNRVISARIKELNAHAEKVAEILASIMQVADRTDLLALNAALEGTRAGEAGRGFSLVASEMRALAENVMESVAGIRRLMNDVRDASQAAVVASQDGTGFSEETTRSAREIALVTQEQRKGTDMVKDSMDEMSELLHHTIASIKQTTQSAETLGSLARSLSGLVGRTDRVKRRNGQSAAPGPEEVAPTPPRASQN